MLKTSLNSLKLLSWMVLISMNGLVKEDLGHVVKDNVKLLVEEDPLAEDEVVSDGLFQAQFSRAFEMPTISMASIGQFLHPCSNMAFLFITAVFTALYTALTFLKDRSLFMAKFGSISQGESPSLVV